MFSVYPLHLTRPKAENGEVNLADSPEGFIMSPNAAKLQQRQYITLRQLPKYTEVTLDIYGTSDYDGFIEIFPFTKYAKAINVSSNAKRTLKYFIGPSEQPNYFSIDTRNLSVVIKYSGICIMC